MTITPMRHSNHGTPITADRAVCPSIEEASTAFAPGAHIGLISGATVALIEQDNASTREKLWALVSVDAPLDDVLDELALDGIKQLPDFGLAQLEDDGVRIVARGSVMVTLTAHDGSERIVDPSAVRTWVEELVTGVAAVSIELPEADGGPTGLNAEGGFFVTSGSVPARSLVRHLAPDASNGASTGVSNDVGHHMTQPAEVVEAEVELVDAVEVLEEPDELFAEMKTEMESEMEMEPDEPVDVAPLPQAVLAFANGDRVPVDRSVLVGRNPKVTGVLNVDLPRIMRFDGPGQGLSRTHAEIRLENGQLVIEDLQSTNGTEVERPGEARERIESGHPTFLSFGTKIVFGDELICSVEPPEQTAE